jgi:WD40 repeat protein
VKIWDVQTGQELKTLRGHSGDLYTVAFSPDNDGRWIASAGEDSTGLLTRLAFRGPDSFRDRKGLDLWYRPQREEPE